MGWMDGRMNRQDPHWDQLVQLHNNDDEKIVPSPDNKRA